MTKPPPDEAPALTPAQMRRFTRCMNELNALIADIRKTHPEANYYLEEGSMLILSGPSHDGPTLRPHKERKMALHQLHYSGGGAW